MKLELNTEHRMKFVVEGWYIHYIAYEEADRISDWDCKYLQIRQHVECSDYEQRVWKLLVSS
jgi:hypothetical protein